MGVHVSRALASEMNQSLESCFIFPRGGFCMLWCLTFNVQNIQYKIEEEISISKSKDADRIARVGIYNSFAVMWNLSFYDSKIYKEQRTAQKCVILSLWNVWLRTSQSYTPKFEVLCFLLQYDTLTALKLRKSTPYTFKHCEAFKYKEIVASLQALVKQP